MAAGDQGDALSQVIAQVSAADPGALSQDFINKLVAYYQGLASQQQQALIKNLQQHTSSASDFTTYVQNNTQVGSTSTAGLNSPGPAPGPSASPAPSSSSSSNTASGQQSQQVTAAQTNVGQLSETAPGGIPVPGSASRGQPGFNEMLQSYNQEQYDAAGSDLTSLAELSGTDPATLQQQYQSYVSGWQTAQSSPMDNLKPGYANYERASQQQPPLTLSEFAQGQGQALMGAWSAVMSLIGQVYQSQTGAPMPSDLTRQILTSLQQMPTNQQSNVLYNAYMYMQNYQSAQSNKALVDQQGTLQASVLSALPSSILTYSAGTGPGTGSFGTAGVVGQYMQLHPSQLMQTSATDAMISNVFQQALGRAPSADDLTALGSSPSPQQVSDYINTLAMPGYPGMTYGQYQAVSKNMGTLWNQDFGRAPTKQELMWGVGKSQAQLQDFVNNSPSSIPGVTIGKYNDITNWIQTTGTSGSTTHAFSAGVDDSLVQDLHTQLQKASTQSPTPGPLSP